MSELEDAHEILADELSGLIRDVVMLHRPDEYGTCAGCAVLPMEMGLPGEAPYQDWPCRTIRLIQDETGIMP